MIAIDTSAMETIGDTFLNVVEDTEKEILKILVGMLFPECGIDEEDAGKRSFRRRIADVNDTSSDDETVNNSTSSSSADEIVGISSKPWDLATGGEVIDYSHRLFFVKRQP